MLIPVPKPTLKPAPTRPRTAALGDMLRRRRGELLHDIQGRLRLGRADGSVGIADALDLAIAASQSEMDLGLLEIQTKTLARIDAAIGRLETGRYGRCLECEVDIAEARLLALPFATRCHTCERAREEAVESLRGVSEAARA